MSRTAPAITTTLPVAPGTSVVTPMYTSVGFNAGDYVYQYGANLVGWPKGSTVNMGPENTLIGGTTYTGYAQSGVNSRTASYGPFSDTITYTGTTVTTGQSIVSPTTLSGATYATGSCKCVTLTDGRIAYAYRSASSTLITAIYTAAGVLQGTTTTLSTNVGFSIPIFSMAALSDGGFVVCFYDNNISQASYCRLNSSNAITVNNAQIYGGSVSSLQAAATQNYYAFTYHTSPGSASVLGKIYTMGNTLIANINQSVNTCYSTGCAGTSSDTFYIAGSDTTSNVTLFWHMNSGGSTLGTYTFSGAGTASGFIAGVGSTSNSSYPGAYAANFAVLNGSNNIVMLRLYTASTSISPSVTSTNTGLGFGNFAIGSINNGGSVLIYRGSGGVLNYATYSAASSQIATGTLAAGSIVDVSIGVTGIAGGTFAYCFAPPATGYASFGTAYSATYTNGVTNLTSATSYTPANGYYLLGVALTTASAGSTGVVATNGSANLGASYPNVTSNILFDYTGTAFTARSAINANRGNVFGTNVTLRGLE
jgi:hypothetical protein